MNIFETQILYAQNGTRHHLVSYFAIGTPSSTLTPLSAVQTANVTIRLSRRFPSIMKITLKTLQQKVFTVRKHEVVANLVAYHLSRRLMLTNRTPLGT